MLWTTPSSSGSTTTILLLVVFWRLAGTRLRVHPHLSVHRPLPRRRRPPRPHLLRQTPLLTIAMAVGSSTTTLSLGASWRLVGTRLRVRPHLSVRRPLPRRRRPPRPHLLRQTPLLTIAMAVGSSTTTLSLGASWRLVGTRLRVRPHLSVHRPLPRRRHPPRLLPHPQTPRLTTATATAAGSSSWRSSSRVAGSTMNLIKKRCVQFTYGRYDYL